MVIIERVDGQTLRTAVFCRDIMKSKPHFCTVMSKAIHWSACDRHAS